MLTPLQHEVLHLFDNSMCRDPNVFVFIGFTVFTLLWMLYQSILASQPRPAPPFRSMVATVFLSTTYTAILVIQLLDCCWLAALYGWWLSKVAKGEWYPQGASGLVEWMITCFILCVVCAFLVPGFLFWAITVFRTANKLMQLWSSRTTGASEVALGSDKVSESEDSK